MVEVCRIKAFEGEDCKELIFKVSQPVNTNIKMDNIEIAHRIKNRSIIMKFYDRPSRDELFTKKVNLNGITTAGQGLQSVTKYLRLTLVFMWNSAPREKFNRYFWSLDISQPRYLKSVYSVIIWIIKNVLKFHKMS